MKAGLVTSVTLHVAVLGFGLVSLSAPRALEAVDVESLPVDVIPVESITQVQQGEREAELAETPAPTPTERPEPVEDAEEVGDSEQDLPTPPTPETRPEPVETAAAPPVEEMQPAEEEAAEPAPQPPEAEEAEPEAEPAEDPPEAEVEPETTEEVEPDPVADAIESREAEAEREALPETAPLPEARPEGVRTATTSEPSEAEETETRERADAEARVSDTLDEVAALLDRQEPSGGGAGRSTREAALGGQETTGEELSQSELDALRQQLSKCWNRPVGAENASDLRASIVFNVDRSGSLEGRPRVAASSGHRQFDESAVRAIELCNDRGLALPEGKEEVWAEIRVNFDPSEMY